MNRHRALIIAAAALWALSCGDGTTDPPPDPPRPTTVTVSPATAELTALDATVQLLAQVLDQYGQVMAGAAVSWSSGDASVDASGLVTAAGNGAVTITATDPGGLMATQSISVTVEAANRAPEAVGTIPAQTITAGQQATLDVSSYFSDPDEDTLSYQAATSNDAKRPWLPCPAAT